MKNSPYLDQPFLPLAVVLRSMLAGTEAKIAIAACDTPDCLRRAMERRILVECEVRAHPIVVGGVVRQQMAEVPFPQHHDMVKALTSDRANQPFDMTVLPR